MEERSTKKGKESSGSLIPALLLANALAGYSLFSREGSEADAQQNGGSVAAAARADHANSPSIDNFPNLTVGSRGEWVGFLQSALNRLNYQINVDNSFGPETLKAVQHLKQSARLPNVDIVDRAAWSILTPEYAPSAQSTNRSAMTQSAPKERVSTIESGLDAEVRQEIRNACERVLPGDLGFRTTMMFVVEWEGGYIVDHAGATNLGITGPFYDQYLKSVGLTRSEAKSIEDLNLDDAVIIYAKNIWEDSHCRELSELSRHNPAAVDQHTTQPLALVVANGAINYGKYRTNEFLRRAINETLDQADLKLPINRSFDANLLRSVANIVTRGKCDELVGNYLDIEEAHYQELGAKEKYSKYLNGWLNRHRSIEQHVKNLNQAGMPQGLLFAGVWIKPDYGQAQVDLTD